MKGRCGRSPCYPLCPSLAGVAPTPPDQLHRCVRHPLRLPFSGPFSRRGCGSMVECGLPKPETRVRFPSPAPTISSAFSQFSRSLSFDCSVLPPRSVAFSGDSCPGIESEGSQWPMSFVCRWDHSSLLTPLFRLRIPEVPIPAWLLSVLGLATPGGFCRWRASLCPQSLLRFQSEGFGHGGFQSGDLVTGKDGVLRELALAF